MRKYIQILVGILGILLQTGCATTPSFMPNDGPLLKRITSQEEKADNFVYGLIDLDATTMEALEKHNYYPLSAHFGLKNTNSGTRIGVGDVLHVTIFEAGPDGIFSTAEKKSINLELTVQENGRISIPYAGEIQASGSVPSQVRSSIIKGLRGKAVDPDVVVNLAKVNSKSVVVNGAVNKATNIPLLNGHERLFDVIGSAGGPSKAPYDTYVSVSRDSVTRTALLQTLIDHPSENIYVRPDDAIFLTYDPRVFTAFGAVSKKGRHTFDTAKLNLMEAAGISGGMDDRRANPGGYFVFRYEYEHVIKHLIEDGSLEMGALSTMLENPDIRDVEGRLPIVYRLDLSDPDNFFVAKRFEVRADDMIYVSRQPVDDFAKFVALVKGTAVSAKDFAIASR